MHDGDAGGDEAGARRSTTALVKRVDNICRGVAVAEAMLVMMMMTMTSMYMQICISAFCMVDCFISRLNMFTRNNKL